jgi:uncharacterized phage protein (TIGR02218 family)
MKIVTGTWPIGNQIYLADLITLTTLQSGTLYLTSSDVDITWNGNTYSSKGVTFVRSKIKNSVGVSVDELDISFFGNSATLINGKSFFQAVIAGVFDGATFELDRAAMATFGTVYGAIKNHFKGIVGAIDIGRTEAKFKIMSNMYLLNIQMPKNVYQPGCINTLYDATCGLPRTAVAGTVTAGSTQQLINCSGATSTQATGYFNLGYLTFTSGVNNGISRTINTSNGPIVNLLNGFPNVPGVGDTFNAYFGCDKQMSTCNAREVTVGMQASFATNVMIITSAPSSGYVEVEQTVTGTGLPTGTVIEQLLTGSFGAAGSTYQLSKTTGTLTARAVTATGNLARFRGFPFIPPPDVLT